MRLGTFGTFRTLAISIMSTLGLLIATQACTASNTATKEDRLCTPGAYVFCRCADRTEGTKLCKDDGRSFEACGTNGDGLCVGGEIPDPNTNKEVPNPNSENPDPNNPNQPNTDPSAVLTCPGKSTAIQPGVDVKFEDDTTNGTEDRAGKTGACAVGTGAKDHVYHLIPSGTGGLEVKVQGIGNLNPLAYIRSACDNVESQVSCAPPGPNALAQLKVNVVTGHDYFLIVDGASGSEGHYAVTAHLTTGSFCGDGKVDSGEACDDVNKIDDDGCGNDCKHITGNPTSGAACPGHPVDLWTGSTVTGTGSTAAAGYSNTWTAPNYTCSNTGSNGANDHIYAITPHSSGTITATVTPTGNFNFMLTARTTCSDASTQGAGMCANNDVAGNPETLSVAATANQPIFIAVDGGSTAATTNKGDYTISFSLGQ